MSYSNPFDQNPNYKLLFQVRSEVTKCDIQEVIELYQHKTNQFYVLFRFQYVNNMMPIRFYHKFTEAISMEVTDNGSQSALQITTTFKDYLTVFQQITICCGSKTYVLKAEQELSRTLFS